ncbi:DUF4214 domain-containing protein [Pararhizobium haloflavum]|uniref:DUF4214 domain-containing protein n=1 Tax=Pararhizobium haloflavum TaxID=2037914 RepID=UPI000C18807B|nr:DUF4214 domain-containing protein [Pararhizobium haloflavum]
MATIQGIYIAVLGRPADPAGLVYWTEATNGGQDLSVMLAALSNTAEYQARFAEMTNTEIITSVYQSLFNRGPDDAGLAYFLDALEDGTLNLASIAVGILDGAQGADATTAANKEAAATAFTMALDSNAEIAAYQGQAAADAAGALLVPVTSDPASIPSEDEIDAAIDEIEAIAGEDTDPPTAPDIFVIENDDGTYSIGVVGEAGSRIDILRNGEAFASVTLDGQGTGQIALDTLDASARFTATAMDASGNESGILGTLIVGTGDGDAIDATDLTEPARLVGLGGDDELIAGEGDSDLLGGDGNDFLLGGVGADFLSGGDSEDAFIGGDGADQMDGGADFDELIYVEEQGGGTVRIDLSERVAGNATDTYGNLDTVWDFEGFTLTDGNDVFVGQDGLLHIIRPQRGDDTIDGGVGGLKEINYGSGNLFARVEVDLTTGEAIKFYDDESFNTDTLSNIDRVRGSNGDDLLLGDSNDNRFRGLDGVDTIDGGAGIDEVDHSTESGSAGVTVDMRAGTHIDTYGNIDVVSNVEVVTGSSMADKIQGSDDGDQIRGNGGDDRITGRGGADTMSGGDGIDTYIFNRTHTLASSTEDDSVIDIITDFEVGVDLLGFGADGGVPAVQSSENTSFGDGSASYEDAYVAANAGFGGLRYFADEVNGSTFVFVDRDGDGTADEVVQLSGTALTDLIA